MCMYTQFELIRSVPAVFIGSVRVRVVGRV
jgi:hypothetical protein